jgi:hypothetical protein
MNIDRAFTATQRALDELDNFEACNALDPGELEVWKLARRRLLNSMACMADISALMAARG